MTSASRGDEVVVPSEAGNGGVAVVVVVVKISLYELFSAATIRQLCVDKYGMLISVRLSDCSPAKIKFCSLYFPYFFFYSKIKILNCE